MSDEQWVVIPNWDKFQHYKDREPVWIKLYTELNSNDEWLELSTAARGMLTTIWVEYARSRGRLRVEKVMQLCGKSARSVHLVSLNHAGFIELSASKPLALARSREKEKEKKKKEEKKGLLADLQPNPDPEPPPDPEALEKIRALAARIGR